MTVGDSPDEQKELEFPLALIPMKRTSGNGVTFSRLAAPWLCRSGCEVIFRLEKRWPALNTQCLLQIDPVHLGRGIRKAFLGYNQRQ